MVYLALHLHAQRSLATGIRQTGAVSHSRHVETGTVVHEPQHTVAEIVESLRDDCLWEDKEAEYAILKNAEAMVKDQMFKAGGAEQLIKSWLVQKVGNSLLGTLECIVLVLTSGSFYQVSYDPIANKLLKWSVWQNPIHLDQNFF